MDGWMDGWIDGWMDGWMDCWTQIDTFPFILFLSAFQTHPFCHYSKLFEMREVNRASRWGRIDKPKNNKNTLRFSIEHLHVFSRRKFLAIFIYFHFTHRIAKVAANHFLHESDVFNGLFDIMGAVNWPFRWEPRANQKSG